MSLDKIKRYLNYSFLLNILGISLIYYSYKNIYSTFFSISIMLELIFIMITTILIRLINTLNKYFTNK